MSVSWRIVALRWSLTFAALRKSVWQTVGYVIGVLASLAAVIAAAFLFSWLGSVPSTASSPQEWLADVSLVRSVLILLTTVGGILWMIIPLTLTGEGSSLSPRRFVLYGIDDARLTTGILLSALCGIPAVAALIGLFFAAGAYRSLGVGAVITGVIAAILAVVVAVSISKALIALAGSLIRSKRGQMILYVAVIALMIIVFEVPGQVMASVGESSITFENLVVVLAAVASIGSWTPWGAPFQMPMDVAQGNWAGLAARLVIIGASIAVAYYVSLWCLRRDRLQGQDSKATVAKGLGWLVRVPDSVSGAVTGRIAQYWQRDGRYAMGLIMPVILTVIFIIRAGKEPAVLWGAPLTMGMIYPMIESNNLAYDGTGFAMHALAGVSGRDDRVGRARVSVVVSMFFVIVTSLIAMFATHAFGGGLAMDISLAAVGGAIGFVLAGIGLAEVLSTVLIYPVASADKPFSSPQGRVAAQGFFPFIQMLGSFLLMVPTIGVLIGILVGTGDPGLLWVVGLVGVINGVAFLVGGVTLGGKILDRRIPQVLATLSNYASLQK
ncbi:MAG: ABC transporter permease [Bifidobacteriaceae bacterium]|jgi:ABC-2 type transport system permease protein|nr:ABC transporter permease [Bifidobacteriaceae bacterium]